MSSTLLSRADMDVTVPEQGRVIAIFGPPGAGKTTVARALAHTLQAVYISSGDIAREVDPEALARGEMADRAVLREAFLSAMEAAGDQQVVVDGLPRDPTDIELLPGRGETMFILLNVRRDISTERQLRRGREGDTEALIARRNDEQRALMEIDTANGWPYELAGWKQSLATDRHTAEYVIKLVTDYIHGKRSTIG